MTISRWVNDTGDEWILEPVSKEDDARIRRGLFSKRPDGCCKRCHFENVAPTTPAIYGSKYCAKHKCSFPQCKRHAIISIGDWCVYHHPNKLQRQWSISGNMLHCGLMPLRGQRTKGVLSHKLTESKDESEHISSDLSCGIQTDRIKISKKHNNTNKKE